MALVALTSCDPTRRVPQGSYLLKRNHVKVASNSVESSQLELIVKQKPNKRILWVPLYLYSYNLPDPDKIPLWQARKNARMDRKNAKRVARGKEPKPYKRTRAEWLRETVGEAPAILDTALVDRSSEQIRLYMVKEGWYQATVRDTVHHNRRKFLSSKRGRPYKRPKVDVEYIVDPGPMYRYRNIDFQVNDPAIHAMVRQSWSNTLLDSGARADADVADDERTRVTNILRDDGYLYFTRELVRYGADTTVGDHQVDLVMRIERPISGKNRGVQGTPEGTRYILKDVHVATYRQPRGTGLLPVDTLEYNGYSFLYRNKLEYRPKALLHPIFLRPGELYQQTNASRTYRRLTGLNVFDRVDIAYDTTNTGAPGLANTRITLIPGKEQNLSLEGFGTNRGGALGTQVSISYKHRNLFGTMGSLLLQSNFGLEAQQQITGASSTSNEATGGVGTGSLFNTVSVGPEMTLGFPLRIGSDRSGGGRLLFNALYNYQRRPDYTRELAKYSGGIQWSESLANTIGVFPLEFNTIKIPHKSDAFEAYLREANDPVLRDSYTDHLIVSHRAFFTHSTPEGERKRNAFFGRAVFELAGTPLRWIHQLGDAPLTTDTAGNSFHTLAGIRYAEFMKLDVEGRWRRTLHDKSSVAFRAAFGAGLPYGNLSVLPFETSFFVGGANGLRAWRARSIGPGSYSAPLVAFDRIGEIRIEGNAEYRFKLIGFLEGAFFADVGNIWNFNEDERKPGGDFSKEFISEVAVGTGVGARLNFNFFIVRFDLGLQTKDPSLPRGERWLFQPKEEYNASVAELIGAPYSYKPQFNFNLGIGYPF